MFPGAGFAVFGLRCSASIRLRFRGAPGRRRPTSTPSRFRKSRSMRLPANSGDGDAIALKYSSCSSGRHGRRCSLSSWRRPSKLVSAGSIAHRGRSNGLPTTAQAISPGTPRAFARDIGLEPLTTPVTGPQSNGRAEAVGSTIKRDDFSANPLPDAGAVFESLPGWLDPCNAIHPHGASRYRSPSNQTGRP